MLLLYSIKAMCKTKLTNLKTIKMPNPYSVLVEKIALENFQSLRSRVEIPIRPLTFLFGPNSAGKSSIYDSLNFINAFFKSDRSIIESLFKRWAHIKPSDSNGNVAIIETMKIEIQFSCQEFLFGGFHGTLGDPASVPEEFWNSSVLKNLISESEGPYDLKLELIPTIFQSKEDGYVSQSLMASYDLTVSVRGLKLMRLFTPEDEDVYEIEFFSEAFSQIFYDLADRHGVSSSDPRLYKVQCWPYNFGRGLELQDDANNGSYERDLVRVANHIIRCFSESNFLPAVVSSDRSTISNIELSNFFNSPWSRDGIPQEFINAPIGAVESFGNAGQGAIKAISKSKFKQLLIEKNIITRLKEDEPLIDFVNRSLSHHLFLDQGYQIVFDICELLSPIGVSNDKDCYVALLIAHLLDSSGRRMTFEDVGTGISCIVPVIVGMYESQSFIQQPELHLHPALQSSLGDILVESVNRKEAGRHLIETHSDYLLLRCLRRIRETSNGRISSDSSLQLSPDKVSVLYFDPQQDGSTLIKSIRISTQGDFLDRWPRGFFEERGKDIFDE